MKFTLKNTSRYPTAEVKRLVRFATSDLDIDRVHFNVKNSSRVRRGYAYGRVPPEANVPAGTRWLITMGLGGPHNWPREEGYWKNGHFRRGGRWPEITIACWREAVIHLAAHEAKHVEQMKERLAISEVACEHYAAWVLKRWRSA